MIYFRHTHVLNYRYKQYNGSNVSYIYLDEGTGQAVFIENTQNIFYCPDYRKTSYREIWNGYKKKTGIYNGKASWSFIIPWSENRLVCCYEGFLLAILDAETGEELQLIDYTPGIAVVGCDFRKAILEGELREELLRNGGRVQYVWVEVSERPLPIVGDVNYLVQGVKGDENVCRGEDYGA